ncbi:GIP [Symbiodinium sp. CCMP2592]|nr:GIP [Symbiodinium sp. CCMP2592]
MRQLEGTQWNMVAITDIEQVHQNLEGLRLETERRTNLLATGLTTVVAGVDQLREAAVQSSQAYGSLNQRVAELTESMKHLAQRVDGIEGQVFLHEAMSQRLTELNEHVLGLESRGLASGEAERETLLKHNKLESDKLWLRILDLQEVVQKLESRPLEEESGRSKELASVMARVVETERICKQLRARDEEIQGHLSHILSREPKPDPVVPTQAHEVQDKGPSGVQTFNMASGTPLQDQTDADRDQWWDAYDEKPIQDWYRDPPGLVNGSWAPSAPPPALPRELVKSETSSAAGHALQLESKDLRVQGGQWKLLKEFPKIDEPRGQAWEKGLQFAQYATEMVSVASCVGSGFARFVRFQIDRALERFKTRMDRGISDWDLIPTTPAGCDEFESRLSMTLLSQTTDEIKRGVIESAAGQVVPSLAILEAILERFQPGGVEEKASLTSFLRNLPHASSFTECLATLRRFKLANSRTSALGLPSHPPHEAIASLNSLVKALEKKNITLSTRLNLLRLRPEILNPTEEGVSLLLTAIESEARRLAAEEFSKPGQSKGYEAGHGEYEITAAKGKGKDKGKKGNASGDTKFIPCAFFNTERGCLKGKDCEYMHAASMAMCESESNSDDHNSPSELSEIDGVGSDDLTPSEFGDELQEESDDEVGWVWSLRLTGLEWRMWTSPGNIVIKAHAEFEHLENYQRLEQGVWQLHRTGMLDELPAVLNEEWTVNAVHPVYVLDPVTRVFKRAEAFELERGDDQSKLRFVVAVDRNRPYVEPWTEDAWVSECLRFGFGASNVHVQDRIPLETMLIGHGFGHLAETLGLLGAEYADDLAVLGPQDLIDNGIPRQEAEDLFQHGGVMYEVHTPTGVRGVPGNEDRIEELAFSLYASWQAGDPVSDEEYDAEVQQRFHRMIRRRRQGFANMCCVSASRVEGDSMVLVDSGANEVLRPQTRSQPGDTPLQVTLASGSHCKATMNKHGEVCMISENGESGSWVLERSLI